MQPIVINGFHTRQKIPLNPEAARTINQLVVAEYMNEFTAGYRPGGRTGASFW